MLCKSLVRLAICGPSAADFLRTAHLQAPNRQLAHEIFARQENAADMVFLDHCFDCIGYDKTTETNNDHLANLSARL
jgi:hypothetical protein